MTTHELTEYQTVRVPWPDPSAADQQLAESLEGKSRLLRIRWLRNEQAEITAFARVGVVTFDQCQVAVRPKMAGGDLSALRMLDYASGIHALRQLPPQRRIETGGLHLRDLVCQMLARAADDILRQGPTRSYLTRERSLPMLRGRILADRQVRARFGQLDQLECRYDEYETDILDNQVLAAGLNLAARSAAAASVRALARRVAADFSALCDPAGLDPIDVAARLHYTRQNEHYRAAHGWSLLLLRGAAISDLYRAGNGQSRVFFFDMNRVFEDFVTRLVEHAFEGSAVEVRPQSRHRSVIVDELTGRPFGTVIPDLLLVRGAGATMWRRVVDAKYKLIGERSLDRADVYQTLLYAQALGATGATQQPPTAVIIHPGTPGSPHRLVARNTEGIRVARLRTVALDVSATLDALADRQHRDRLHAEVRDLLTA
ncbi:hypothetical protein [Dactylosporangium sp. NPDC050588]|uniref:McrC family protein n=1 Tax=Dactylosporangium sp. NPDC050588 TaxID=3157211 RepID=UPI0033E2EDF0